MKPNIILPALLLLISSSNCDHGVKTARHTYSASSSGSNSFASSGYSGSAGASGAFSGNPAFWWAGPNSPFKDASEYFYRCSQKGDCGNIPGPFPGIAANVPNNLPSNGCNDNGCSFSGSYNIHDKQPTGGGEQVDRSKNPFLNGEFQGIAVSSCSGNSCPGGKPQSTITTTHCKGSDCKTNTQQGAPGQTFNLGQNPFQSGASSGSYGGSGASGCKGCTSGSTTYEHGYQGQFGSGSGCSGGSCGGQGQPGSQTGAGCGPSGCSVPPGSYAGSGSYSGSGSFAGSGSQGTQGFVGGCAGTKGGCKPGQSGGQSSGQSGQGQSSAPGLIGGCAGTQGGCKPGQYFPGSSTGSFSGTASTSGSGNTHTSYPQSGPERQPGYSGTSFQPSYTGDNQPGQGQSGAPGSAGGCAGVKGGCKPGQYYPGSSTGSFSGSGSASTSGSGTTLTSFAQTGPNQGQPDYTGTKFQPSYTSGPQSGPGQSGTPGLAGGCSGVKGGCKPGQYFPGSTTGSFAGSSGGSGTTHTSFPQSGPNQGKPGYSGTTFQPGYTSGAQPGQTQHGQTTSGSFSGSSSGSFAGSGSFGGAGSTSGSYDKPLFTSGDQQTPSGSFPGATTSFGSTGSYGGAGSYPGKPTPGIGDLEKCYGDGLFCVEKHLCVNRIANTNGEGLLNVRDGDHYCDVKTETCCKLPDKSGRPYEDRPGNVPAFPGGTTSFHQTTNSHHASSSSAASSSSSTSSFGSGTYFGTSPSGIGNRYTPGPTAGGVQPGGSKPSYVPGQNYQPGQTINLPGKDGQSPGVIQVVPEGYPGKTPAPGLIRPQTGLQEYGPGQAPALRTTPAFQQFGPGQAPGLRTTPGVDVRPNGGNSIFDSTAAGSETREYNFPSTLQGPAYLPPGPSPSPSPSSFTPDLLPPDRYPSPASPKPTPYYPPPTTPKPTAYYPAPTTAPNRYNPPQQTTPAYLPPSQTPTRFSPTTRKPQVTNAYLPPQVPSATGGDNQYLPPPQDPQYKPDSNIINISVIPPDRVPDGTNGDPSVLRPTPRPTPRPTQNIRTDFGQNTTPYPGCAAALKCVSGEFCTADGTISKVRVLLTPEQEVNRVPTTECSDPESGIIGRCCRDPDYKDPWPSTQLNLFNPDQAFQGSSPAGSRPRPPPGVKGGRRPYEPNQIGSPSNTPNSVIRPGYPTNVPNVPFDSRLVNVPQQVDFKPPVENRYDNSFAQSQIVKNSETCGVRHPGGQPRGTGPIDASFAEIPWQAMILRETNRSLLCGGAIIRRDVILTAAHCVEGLRADDVLVKGGEWKLGIDDEPKPFQINKVATIVRHPGYNPQNKFNDVALLILKEKFRLDKNVDTLCLPEPNEDVAQKFQNSKCITTGWGKTILQLHIQNSIMHILGVGILPGSQCQQRLQQQHSESANLYNTNCVCGVPSQPQSDICDVDIGSALACEGPDGRYTLAGIYSWDTGCNPTAQVAGYTRVDTQWVSQTLQRPIKDLKTEESGFYQKLAGQDCHCLPGKK